MKCLFCHGEAIEPAELKEEVKVEADIVYVPIRALVCRTCGERYYDRSTIQFLEGVTEKLRHERGHLREVGKVLLYS